MSAKTISRPVVLALVLLGLSPSARARVVDVTTQRVHFKGYAAVSSSGEALLLLWDQRVGNGDVQLWYGITDLRGSWRARPRRLLEGVTFPAVQAFWSGKAWQAVICGDSSNDSRPSVRWVEIAAGGTHGPIRLHEPRGKIDGLHCGGGVLHLGRVLVPVHRKVDVYETEEHAWPMHHVRFVHLQSRPVELGRLRLRVATIDRLLQVGKSVLGVESTGRLYSVPMRTGKPAVARKIGRVDRDSDVVGDRVLGAPDGLLVLQQKHSGRTFRADDTRSVFRYLLEQRSARGRRRGKPRELAVNLDEVIAFLPADASTHAMVGRQHHPRELVAFKLSRDGKIASRGAGMAYDVKDQSSRPCAASAVTAEAVVCLGWDSKSGHIRLAFLPLR